MPPCSTSKYMESARARSQDGDIVCAATFRHASMPIHAKPAANSTIHNHSSFCTRPAAKVIPANSTIANATRPSTDNLCLISGNTPAPASAPTPKLASSKPNPPGPYGRAITGSKANTAAAAMLNAPSEPAPISPEVTLERNASLRLSTPVPGPASLPRSGASSNGTRRRSLRRKKRHSTGRLLRNPRLQRRALQFPVPTARATL